MPELVVLGTTALYELRYTPEGDLDGAVRHTGRELIGACRRDIEQLLAESSDSGAPDRPANGRRRALSTPAVRIALSVLAIAASAALVLLSP